MLQRSDPGKSLRRSLATRSLRAYGLQYATGVPVAVALLVGIAAGLLTPENLDENDNHEEMSGLLATAGQLIGTLLVALVVEARTPLTQTGVVAARQLAGVAGTIIGGAGFAAVVALSPGLPGCVYPWLVGATVGGLAGGLVAIVWLGISLAVGALRRLEWQALKELAEEGDPGAKARLRELEGKWGLPEGSG